MTVVVIAMGIVMFILVACLHDESVKTAKLSTEVRMLRERYEPDDTQKGK